MSFTLVHLSEEEEMRAFPNWKSSGCWLSNSSMAVDPSTGGRFYFERCAAGNDTIDRAYFEEHGEQTEVYPNKKGWIWMPTHDLSRQQVKSRHARIREALAVYGSPGPLASGPRPSDVALRARIVNFIAISLYSAVLSSLLWLAYAQ